MAGEIIVTAGLRLANGDLDSTNIGPDTFSITQNTAAPVRVAGSQSIGFAAHEALTVTDLTTLGVGYLRNRDDTNFVEVGLDVGGTFYPLLRINANEAYPVRFSQSATVYAKADTAAVILERVILDD